MDNDADLVPEKKKAEYEEFAKYFKEWNATQAIVGPVKSYSYERYGEEKTELVVETAGGDVLPLHYALSHKANMEAQMAGFFFGKGNEKRARKAIEYLERSCKTVNELRDFEPFMHMSSHLRQNYIVLRMFHRDLGEKEKAEHYDKLIKDIEALDEHDTNICNSH